jgi:hypothetical protein
MFPSAEVRWFYKGQVPGQVWAWFAEGEHLPSEQVPRVDYYLHIEETDSLGLKLREGRVEIKQRHCQYGVVRVRERVAGMMEHWRKWSLPLAEAGADWATILKPAPSWIGVEKGRWLRKYQMVADGRVAAIPADEVLGQGCGVELTRLRVAGDAWWSLGFEAFGDESSLREDLVYVMDHFFARGSVPLSFEARNSYGYPRWLTLLKRLA